jgi:ComF family protein
MWALLSDFLRLLFPNNCEVCGTALVKGESVICLHCRRHLPKTYYWQQKDNPVEQVFWGRLPIVNACAFFFMYKGSNYRKLIHKLKYNHIPQIGVALGQMFGTELASSDYYAEDAVLVPVPLHPKRYRKRGYNQSERIAVGMAQSMGIPVIENAILRRQYNETQTKKTRQERLQNVQNIFCAGADIQLLQGKHVIVVDDVLTTGATLEACINTLLRNADCRISVAALAVAR